MLGVIRDGYTSFFLAFSFEYEWRKILFFELWLLKQCLITSSYKICNYNIVTHGCPMYLAVIRYFWAIDVTNVASVKI